MSKRVSQNKNIMSESVSPVDTGRKLNVHKTPRTSSERLMYVQLTSCVYWVHAGYVNWQVT